MSLKGAEGYELGDVELEIESRTREASPLIWGKTYFPEKFTQPFCQELHQYFVDIKDEPLTATLAPRGHAKTTIACFLIPIYHALVTPHKYRHTLNIQNTHRKAIDINLQIRYEIEHNERLRADYGDMVSDEKWTETRFVLKNGAIFSACGAGESVRGINHRNVRPDYIIADDMYDDEDMHNMDRIQKKKAWFWGTIYPARNQSKDSRIHIQGTAINKYDLMHELIKTDGVTGRRFQAVIDFDQKKTLWRDFDDLMHDKDLMGSIQFSREMQNE